MQNGRTVAALIGPSIVIRGEIVSLEDLIIEGQVDGRIDVRGHQLTIGTGAGIVADLAAPRITIRGMVTGQVTASDTVAIGETGSVDGDVRAPRIAVEDGAQIHGRVETVAGIAAQTKAVPEAIAAAV